LGKLEDAWERSIEPATAPAEVYETFKVALVSIVGIGSQIDPDDLKQFIDDSHRLFERGSGWIGRPFPFDIAVACHNLP
jgi:hypothetical protein